MEILLVTGSFPERSETFIYRKAVGLAARGHDVTVAARRRGDWELYPDPLPPSLRVEQLVPDDSLRAPGRALAAAVGSLRHALRTPGDARRVYDRVRAHGHATRAWLRYMPFADRSVDVVHFEFLSLGAMYSLAREITGRPVVVSCRGRDVHTLELREPHERETQLACLRAADALHCVSQEMAGEVTRLTGRTNGVWVNRPAVDVERITPRPPATTRGPLRLLATGRLVWKKGFDYLLAALARLAKRGVDFHAQILGDGELYAALRFSIEDLGLAGRVELCGAVSSAEVLARMQSTDVFVLSSHEEGISNAALEAMASGVPVVTTTAGGMVEAVSDGVEGFVVPVRDIPALADRIERLAHDRDLCASMGRAARARAVAEFSLERQIDTFEALYRSLVRT